MSRPERFAGVLLLTLLMSGCANARAAQPSSSSPAARPAYTRADVSFVQGMIGHHAQALLMTRLVPTRTNRPELRLLAERIEVSQKAEIERMQRWLAKRSEPVPAADATDHAAAGHGTLMPGMLTAEELAALGNATGTAFERMFLTLMIRHHEGAIKMVEDLLATPDAGQEPELFMFASDVNADQSAEIRRMRALLASLPA